MVNTKLNSSFNCILPVLDQLILGLSPVLDFIALILLFVLLPILPSISANLTTSSAKVSSFDFSIITGKTLKEKAIIITTTNKIKTVSIIPSPFLSFKRFISTSFLKIILPYSLLFE
jgi:hypothetical protein